MSAIRLTVATNHVVVRVGSHRARRKLIALLNGKPPAYFSFKFKGEFIPVPVERAGEALAITGISRTKHQLSELIQCWS